MNTLYSLLLALFQWLAFLFLWRAVYPNAGSILFNPWLLPFIRITDRILDTVRSAITLPQRNLCWILCGVALICRATLLAKLGEAVWSIGTFQFFLFKPVGFFGWVGFQLLQFVGFLLALHAGALFLRIWNRSERLPGTVGILVDTLTWPLPRLRPWVQALAIFFVGALVVRIGFMFSPEVKDVFVMSMQKVAPSVASFDPSTLNLTAQSLFVSGCILISAADALANLLLLFMFMSLLTLLFNNPVMVAFLSESFGLLRGPLPNVRLGPFGIMTVVAFFALQLITALLMALWVSFFMVVAHVV